jgi:hypothetical protein
MSSSGVIIEELNENGEIVSILPTISDPNEMEPTYPRPDASEIRSRESVVIHALSGTPITQGNISDITNIVFGEVMGSMFQNGPNSLRTLFDTL